MSSEEEPFQQPAPLLVNPPLFNGTYYTKDDQQDFEDHLRLIDEHGHSIAQAVDYEYGRLTAREIARERHRILNAGPPSWARIDPESIIEKAQEPIVPTVGRWTGEACLGVFYAECINSVVGSSETGKSWLALYVCVQEIKAGHNVVYVDYEGDPGSIGRRLFDLGLTREELARFRYHNPNGPLTDAEKVHLADSLADGGTLAVFDGLTEGMSLEGLEGRHENEVAAWHARVTKDLAKDGWCVVVVDHTPHTEQRAIGSQHKKACISGVSYVVDATHPIDAGERGVLRLRIEKDRHASVRAEAARGASPRWRGDLVVDATVTPMQANLFPAKRTTESDDKGYEEAPPRPRLVPIMGYVSTNPGCSLNNITEAVKGRKQTIMSDVEWLVRNNYIRTSMGTNRKQEHEAVKDLPTPAGEID